jgi:hypothetical protein
MTSWQRFVRSGWWWAVPALVIGTGLSADPVSAAAASASHQLSSGVVHWQGVEWRAEAVQASNSGAISLSISRLTAGAWQVQGEVALRTGGPEPEASNLGDKGETLSAVDLTGAPTPDFLIVTQGEYPGQPWFSVISGIGGHWHLVPVDFGYRPLLGVPAEVKVEKGRLRVEVEGGDGSGYEPSYTTVGWYQFDQDSFAPADPLGATPSCTVASVGDLPSTNGQPVPPAHYACQDGWALLTGTFDGGPYLELMNWQGSSWQQVEAGGQLDDAPMWYGLPLATLQVLGAAVGGPGVALAGAAKVISQYPAAATEEYGISLPELADSGVVYLYNQAWLAVASGNSGSAATALTVVVYRWEGTSFAAQGSSRIAYFGQLEVSPDGGGVVPVWLTGGSAPDFAVNGEGADTHWFAVFADLGGRWQGVRFDYVRGPEVAIDEATISGSLVEAELNACGCATGPESDLWYQYSAAQREFLPTDPPGPAAPCTTALMQQDLVVAGVNFSRVACADGWAAAIGREGDVGEMALFEEDGTGWQAVASTRAAVVSRGTLSHMVADYLVPSSVLAKLASGLHL